MTMRSLSMLAVVVLMLTMLVGCRSNASTDNSTATTTTTTIAATTTTAADELFGTTTTNMTPAATMAVSVTAEQAQDIALADANLTAADVTGLRTEFEYDDRTPHYDVQFYQGLTEYDYDIDAQTGAILEKDRDIED